MKRILVLCSALFVASSSFGFGNKDSWIGSGAIGATFGPDFFLLNPQLEYVLEPNLFVGPMFQVAIGNPGVLFTASGTVRTHLGKHPKAKPSLEGGLGIAAASSFAANSVGVHIHIGMGFDYLIDKTISVGTMFRMNFAPPLDTFFVSWPVLIGRFAF